MKVECLKIIDPNTNIIENSLKGFGLEIGKIFLVLEIYIFLNKNEINFRLDDGSDVPISANAKQFKMICNQIPSNWTTKYDYTNGNLYFGPAKWLNDDLWEFSFWEDYLSFSNHKADQVFKEEIKKIREEMEEKYPKEYKQSDIWYIENIVEGAKKYLDNKINNYEIISEMDWLCSELSEYKDLKLQRFQDYWAKICKIKQEIKEGKSIQKDLEEYITLKTNIITKTCKELFEEYIPILGELKKKFPN